MYNSARAREAEQFSFSSFLERKDMRGEEEAGGRRGTTRKAGEKNKENDEKKRREKKTIEKIHHRIDSLTRRYFMVWGY